MPASLHEERHGSYLLSSDKNRLDLDVIHTHLSESAYWALGRPRETVERSIEHSYLVMGAYDRQGAQVGFARMVTDLATWAWLCDVFVLPSNKASDLARRWLVQPLSIPTSSLSVGNSSLLRMLTISTPSSGTHHWTTRHVG